jgi:signal transduction histidine kinase
LCTAPIGESDVEIRNHYHVDRARHAAGFVMRLSEFIRAEREPIMAEWEMFARSLGTVTESLDIVALRDHASQMLTVIATDLETPQSDSEQHEKAVGNAPDGWSITAAQAHGADRAERGFSTDQMVSEFRALRASVIRLWMKARGDLTNDEVRELTRFNEAIDQALAESVSRYTGDLSTSKEMFIAILGHDLRTPLGSIITSSTFMLDLNELAEPYRSLTARIASSSRRMDRMVGDLLDLTRSRLGGGIPITRAWMNVEEALREVAAELIVQHADRAIDVSATGDVRGRWDRGRVSQVLSNLLGNAVAHGAVDTPVRVVIDGTGDEVSIAVHNHGVPIPGRLIPRIFDPMKRRQANGRRPASAGGQLGLGLYIANQIVAGHHGRIDVESSASGGTTFTVRMPRDQAQVTPDARTPRRTAPRAPGTERQ